MRGFYVFEDSYSPLNSKYLRTGHRLPTSRFFWLRSRLKMLSVHPSTHLSVCLSKSSSNLAVLWLIYPMTCIIYDSSNSVLQKYWKRWIVLDILGGLQQLVGHPGIERLLPILAWLFPRGLPHPCPKKIHCRVVFLV